MTCSSTTERWTATSSGCDASSAPQTLSSEPSKRSMAPDTASRMAENGLRGHLDRLHFPLSASLTARILAVNLIPLLLLAGSLFFLDSYNRKSTRLNSSHVKISYAVFCLKKKRNP